MVWWCCLLAWIINFTRVDDRSQPLIIQLKYQLPEPFLPEASVNQK